VNPNPVEIAVNTSRRYYATSLATLPSTLAHIYLKEYRLSLRDIA
jgi:hypothetical protein